MNETPNPGVMPSPAPADYAPPNPAGAVYPPPAGAARYAAPAPPPASEVLATPAAPATPVPPAAPEAPETPADYAPPHPLQMVMPGEPSGPTIVDTSSGKNDGLNKCPRCGSAEISTQPGTGMLQCHYCRFVFEPPQVSGFRAADELVGETVGSGAADITQPENTQVTIKCQGCGAEVVVDVTETMTARCHWCRQVLSIENQIPNGAVPDILLPFLLGKDQARARIEEFVKKRTFFANGTFKREFTTENITGVYLPYLVIDVNAHSDLRGQAGRVARRYRRGRKDHEETFYDIDVYSIGRDFDLAINGLTVEASSERRNVDIWSNTNNVINSIMPFDVENAIAYNGNYLKGFTSERRDTNIDSLRGLVDTQLRDIARFQANGTAKGYDAGIRWEYDDTLVKGSQWRAAYLPVWLYSYLEVKGGGRKLLHYVAVNARTGETMGSVPVDVKRLVLVAAVIEIIAVPLGLLVMMMA